MSETESYNKKTQAASHFEKKRTVRIKGKTKNVYRATVQTADPI